MAAQTQDIKEHASVVGSDGQAVGTVDHVNGDQIKLTKNDPNAGGVHHLVPLSLVAKVDGKTVHLSKTAAQVKASWKPA